MKLYRVQVTKVIYVLAQDALEASVAGQHHVERDDGEPDVEVTPATAKSLQADGWRNALVYGEPDRDVTGAEALKDCGQ